jgi:hypothetical protein
MADDELRLIAPPAYFLTLASVAVPDGGGMLTCPVPDHDDAYASCHVYGEAEQGWWCFGCSRGGRIYDLASMMSGGAWGASCGARRFGRSGRWWRQRFADARRHAVVISPSGPWPVGIEPVSTGRVRKR